MNEGKPGEREFTDRVRKALRESEQLDYVTASRLSSARKRALESGRNPRWQWAAISGALAAALVVAVFAPWRSFELPDPPASADSAHLEVLDILGDEMEPEFYRDLELYQWLSQEPARHV